MNDVKKEFYEHLKNAIIASLNYLKEKADENEIHKINYGDFIVNLENKEWIMSVKQKYFYLPLIKKYRGELLNLTEIKSCIEFITKNELYETNQVYEEIIERFLILYLDTNQNFEFDNTIFEKLYDKLEEYLSTDGKYIIVTPLYNFELEDVDYINLDDENSISIRKLTEEEVKMLLCMGYLKDYSLEYLLFRNIPNTLHGGYIETVWCIEYGENFMKKSLVDFESEIHKIITALRLFKAGSVSCSEILVYQKTTWRDLDEISFCLSMSSKIGRDANKYELTKEDVENLREFWNHFKSFDIKEYPFLYVAIRRFNFSYERALTEDKIIDFMIAFEALYFPDEKTELNYRLALRCAYFLGKDESERQKIFELLKNAYDIRSKIVHGKDLQSKSVKKALNKLGLNSLKDLFEEVVKEEDFDKLIENLRKEKKPIVIMLIGVNGSGKTTTAGKLAKYLIKKGFTVVFSASDTFTI